MGLICIILGIICIFCLVIQFCFFGGFDKSFLSSLIPNLLVTVIGIFLSIFVIDKLLERNRYRSNLNVIKDNIGNQYYNFIIKLTYEFLYFVLKKPPHYKLNNQILEFNSQIREIIDNTDKYITKDFIRTPVKIIKINPQDILNPKESKISYQHYCKIFKKNVSNIITEFLGRYISVLPRDIKLSIFSINDQLNSNILQIPDEFGLNVDISNANIDIDVLRRVIKKIAIEIDKLHKLWLKVLDYNI